MENITSPKQWTHFPSGHQFLCVCILQFTILHHNSGVSKLLPNGPRGNIFSFAGETVLVFTMELCWSMKATIANTEANECVCVPITLFMDTETWLTFNFSCVTKYYFSFDFSPQPLKAVKPSIAHQPDTNKWAKSDSQAIGPLPLFYFICKCFEGNNHIFLNEVHENQMFLISAMSINGKDHRNVQSKTRKKRGRKNRDTGNWKVTSLRNARIGRYHCASISWWVIWKHYLCFLL